MLVPLLINLETDSDPGTSITNTNATTAVPKNYEICDRTGFRQYPRFDRLSKMRMEWTGLGVRAQSLDIRHPQEHVKSRGGDKQVGPVSPEASDVFISTSIGPEDL